MKALQGRIYIMFQKSTHSFKFTVETAYGFGEKWLYIIGNEI
jgi:hypothetical protein